MIMHGVQIDDGAVIGTRAVITKNVEPYSIVAGNNHSLKNALMKRPIQSLSDIKWWYCSLEHVECAMACNAVGKLACWENTSLRVWLSNSHISMALRGQAR